MCKILTHIESTYWTLQKRSKWYSTGWTRLLCLLSSNPNFSCVIIPLSSWQYAPFTVAYCECLKGSPCPTLKDLLEFLVQLAISDSYGTDVRTAYQDTPPSWKAARASLVEKQCCKQTLEDSVHSVSMLTGRGTRYWNSLSPQHWLSPLFYW